MISEKLILETSFSIHQKIILIVFSLPFLLFIIAILEVDLNWKGYIIFLLALLFFWAFISLAFSKKGMIKNGGKLYKAKFFQGYTIFKRKVDLNDRPVVSILKSKKRQKFAFFSAAKPDLSESFNTFEIFVLNKNHFKRDSIMYFKNENNAKEAIEFMTKDFPLRHELFNPNYYR
ncbi:hypothetical protein BC962_3248 [Gillisia mitskevichiae]|uniref:PH (Pleckstrin Homology) domain-containing protein n=1 Tax=Gillisia mitskevichiae TaxID=270921 RepID=A0A495NWT5_9FLAO|nr:hypothetical protein [Gillisia mitskevichiae]RKS42523.1 hypothetical protein BC962_3248 [Gillisia mitskevichiae]